MKTILLMMLTFVTYCYGSADPDFYDDDKFLIEMEGHLWRPLVLLHSSLCPCEDIDDDSDYEAAMWGLDD